MDGAGVVIGLVLGGLGALLHLVTTRARAVVAVRGNGRLAILTLPVAVAVPAACLAGGILLAPACAWAPPLGYWMLRSMALARIRAERR